MNKYKISAVSYLNTLPFLYGLETEPAINQYAQISVDYPSLCAQKLAERKVDIGLVPVVLLYQNKDLKPITNYCIGSDGPVDSVLLFSQKPLDKIKQIVLDYQSRTSVNLLKVLAKFYWKINPTWIQGSPEYDEQLQSLDSVLVIGDRAIKLRGKFPYQYDLSQAWKEFTGLPFVFALWTTNRQLDGEFLQVFNQILSIGLNNIDKVLAFYTKKIQPISNYIDVRHYLTHSISYELTDSKKRAIDLFFSYLSRL